MSDYVSVRHYCCGTRIVSHTNYNHGQLPILNFPQERFLSHYCYDDAH